MREYINNIDCTGTSVTLALAGGMSLPDYIEKAILEHHKITNHELSKEWDSWNKLIVKSPHNSIPYSSMSDFVTYSLEEYI